MIEMQHTINISTLFICFYLSERKNGTVRYIAFRVNLSARLVVCCTPCGAIFVDGDREGLTIN